MIDALASTLLGHVTPQAARDAREALDRLPDPTLTGIGAVRADDARIWLRRPHDGPVRLQLESAGGVVQQVELTDPPHADADHTQALWLRDDAGLQLHPDQDYRVLASIGTERQLLRFRTASRTPRSSITIGLTSCHQPFQSDGHVDQRSAAFVAAVSRTFREAAIDRTIMLGDQIYADLPQATSLFEAEPFRLAGRLVRQGEGAEGADSILECSASEVRRLFHQRYRETWGAAGFPALLRAAPCTLVPDDHDFIDNFGTDPAHGSEAWAAFREGATAAFVDYQASWGGVSPTSPFVQTFDVGQVTGITLDLRTERRMDDSELRIISDHQLALIADALKAAQGQEVVIIGLSVPLFYIPPAWVEAARQLLPPGNNVEDRWMHPAANRCRNALLEVLHAHQEACPDQQLVLVSGDLHVGLVTELGWEDPDLPPMLQITSSPVSHRRPAFEHWLASQPADWCAVDEAGPVRTCTRVAGTEVLRDLNAGLVEVRREHDGRSRVRLSLLQEDESGGTQVVTGTDWR